MLLNSPQACRQQYTGKHVYNMTRHVSSGQELPLPPKAVTRDATVFPLEKRPDDRDTVSRPQNHNEGAPKFPPRPVCTGT